MARELGIDELAAINTAAILSPGGRWEDIVARLPAFLAAARDGRALPSMPTYSRNVRRAALAVHGLAVPSGPKVSRFARNLAGDPDVVTVDRWAARGAGLPEHGGARWYRSIEDGYRAAALAVGETPAQFQAILWVALRDGVIPWGPLAPSPVRG
jgi:hypothetical protein